MFRKVLLGIGILLILISLVLIARNGFEIKTNDFKMKDLQGEKKERIIKIARNFGMEFPGQLSRKEIKKQAQRVGLKLKSSSKSNLNQKGQEKRLITVQIKSGTSADGIVEKLHEAEVIKNEDALLELIKKLGVSNKILAGKYEFESNVSLEKVLLTIIGS